jgi:hypothetical protein
VIVLAVVFGGPAILYLAGVALMVRAFTSSDPYPAFMAEYERGHSRTYQDAEREFSDFVVKTFPIGSSGRDAIAQIIEGGFQAEIQTPPSSRFIWKRHAGPCSEQYSIVMKEDPDRRIASIIGRLQPICL